MPLTSPTDDAVDEPTPPSDGDDGATPPPVGRMERIRRWRPRSDLAVGTCVGIGVFAFLLFRYRWLFEGQTVLAGDESNQFGIALDAVILRELRGGGSRTGFHHPGPGYFYVWGLAEAIRQVFHIPMWKDNWEMIGGQVFVAAQLGALVALVRNQLGTVIQGLTVLVALVVLALDPGLVGGPWLPHMYFITFALFIVAGATVAAGRLSILPLYAACVGLLFHGHIAFTSFVGAGTLVLLVAMWRTGDLRRLWNEQRRVLWWTLGVLGLFALPIVVYTLRDWPGELDKYMDYMSNKHTGGHTLREGLRYTLQFWPGTRMADRGALMLVSLGALVGVSWWRRSRFGFAVAVGAVVMELCLLQYAVSGIDDLSFRYAAIWAYSIVGVTVGTAVALALPGWLTRPSTPPAWVAVAVLAIGSVAAMQRSTSLTYTPIRMDTAPAVVDRMESVADGRAMVIDADVNDLGAYLMVPAVLSIAEDRGLEVCFRREEWDVKYGEWRICTPSERRNGVEFTFVGADRKLTAAQRALDPTTYQSSYLIVHDRSRG